MRILQLHTRYRQRGGEDEVVDAEANALQEAGHEVRQMIAYNPQGSLAAVGPLALAPWNPRMVRKAAAIAEEFRPHIAHVHNTWFAMSPAVIHALKAAGVPVVLTLHNYRLTCANGLLFRDGSPCELCVNGSPWQAVRHRCYRESALTSVPAAATVALHRRRRTWVEDVDLFIVLSDFQRRIMTKAGLPSEKLRVKPNLVADPGIRAQPPSASRKVLFVGRLAEEKGLRVLLEAWRIAQPAGLELLVIGDGPLRSEIESKLPSGVRMLGTLPHDVVLSHMLEARAGTFASLSYEGLGLTLLEFLAAGAPVVVGEPGSPAETMAAEVGPEWIYPSKDPWALSEILGRLVVDALCDAAGSRAREAFLQRFNDADSAERLVGLYGTVLTRRAQGHQQANDRSRGTHG